VEDLAEPAGVGPECGWLDAGRQLGGEVADTLLHLLSGAPRIDVVVEHDRHGGDPEPRQAALLVDTGQAAERDLDPTGDEPLDLLGRETRRARQDLDLVAGDVGQRVELQPPRDEAGEQREDEHRRDDVGAAPRRGDDDARQDIERRRR